MAHANKELGSETIKVDLATMSRITAPSEESTNIVDDLKRTVTGPPSHPNDARKNIIIPSLATALDRTEMSSRDATFVFKQAGMNLLTTGLVSA